jgi:hypothetical protein
MAQGQWRAAVAAALVTVIDETFDQADLLLSLRYAVRVVIVLLRGVCERLR